MGRERRDMIYHLSASINTRTLGQNASYTMFYYQLLLPNLESSHLCNFVSLRQATRTAHFCGTNSCHYLLSHCSDSINISLNSGHRPPGTVELLLELSFPFLARALPPVHGSIVLLTPGWLCPCVPLPYIVTAPHAAGNWLTAREQLLHRGRSRRRPTSFTRLRLSFSLSSASNSARDNTFR